MVAVVSWSESRVRNGNERPIASPFKTGTAAGDLVNLMIRTFLPWRPCCSAAISETSKTHRHNRTANLVALLTENEIGVLSISVLEDWKPALLTIPSSLGFTFHINICIPNNSFIHRPATTRILAGILLRVILSYTRYRSIRPRLAGLGMCAVPFISRTPAL